MKSAVFLKSTIHNTPQNLLNGSSMVPQWFLNAFSSLIYSTFIALPSHDHRTTIARPSHDHRTYFSAQIRANYVYNMCSPHINAIFTMHEEEKKSHRKNRIIYFFLQNIWSCQKKVVILHAIYRILRRRFFDYTRLFTKYLYL